MKLSKNTIAMLKNLATINTNLLIRPGSKLSTISTNKNIAAEVDIEETFETQFGIYDLIEFLGALSLFDDPELEFHERHLKISSGRNSIRYLPADQDVLIFPKNVTQKFPANPEIEFELKAEDIQTIIRSASIFKADFLSIRGDGEKMELLVRDKSNTNSNWYMTQLGETDKTFCFNVKVENLKMLPENYLVQISSRKAMRFKGDNKTYLISCEDDSVYEG